MSFTFKANRGLILVSVEITGPTGKAILKLALDTGATSTLIHSGMLVSIGYDPALSTGRYQITTGSGVEYVPKILLRKLRTLGYECQDFPVLCHTLPSSTNVDGVLGLDFFRDKVLQINFKTGEIKLSQE